MAEKIIERNVADEAEAYSKIFGVNKNFYRMIPSFADGLKPGKRRTLWAWWESLKRPTTAKNLKFMKVANIAASALFYHPHGNSAIEESLTAEGQNWNRNVMLIVPQGSYGNVRGDPPSAGRYIEAAPSEYMIDCFFSDFDKYCVPMSPSYDGEREEPEFLPAKYPHALFNPQFSGIGYGLGSNIPPFNVTEVLQATIDLIKNPKKKILLIPDCPTRADIVDDGNFEAINKTGKATLTMRASATIDYVKNVIRITSLPYRIGSEQVIKAIGSYRAKNKLLEIVDIKDYTKEDTVDLYLTLRPDANADDVLKELYDKKCCLKGGYSVIIRLIDDIKSYRYGVKDYLLEWIEWRRDIVRSMFHNEHQQVVEKIHLNAVLLFVFGEGRAEETLAICRKSTSRADTIKNLMARYHKEANMTSIQAAAIADMRLHQFNRESYEKFKKDREELAARLDEVRDILSDDSKLDDYIIKQLREGIKKYGRPRYSRVITVGDDKGEIPNTEHIIGISETGYIKKVDLSETSVIGQVGKHKDNTFVLSIGNREDAIILDSSGQAIRIPIASIPSVSVDDIGVEISRYFKSNGKVISVMKLPTEKILKAKNNTVCITIFTKNGFAKRVRLSELKGISAPRSIITLGEGDEVVATIFSMENSENDVIVYTTNGMGVRKKLNTIKVLGKSAKGSRCIYLDDDEVVSDVTKIDPKKKHLFYLTSKGRVKVTETRYLPVTTGNDKVRILDLDAGETLIYIASVKKSDGIEVYYLHSEPVKFDWTSLDVSLRATPAQKKIRIPRGDRLVTMKVIEAETV